MTHIIDRFWELPCSGRREICLRMKLIDKSEIAFPEQERYSLAIIRCAERKQINEFTREIEKAEQ